jgi:hypothetical protein
MHPLISREEFYCCAFCSFIGHAVQNADISQNFCSQKKTSIEFELENASNFLDHENGLVL